MGSCCFFDFKLISEKKRWSLTKIFALEKEGAMPLMSIEAKPIPGLGWLRFLWVPSRKKTEKAIQELRKSKFPCDLMFPLVRAFATGEMMVGIMIMANGRRLVLKGVYPKMEFPEAMVFWDDDKGRYVQFTAHGCPHDFVVIHK